MKNVSFKILFFLFLTLVIFLLTASYLFYNFSFRSRASSNNIINTQTVTEDSYVQENNSTANFSLHKDEGYLYKSKAEGGAAVLEFLNNDPQYQPEEKSTPQGVKGTSTGRLIPKNFIQNSFLARFFKDREDKFLTARNFNLNGEHFFYNQKINNIPVFGGILAIHLRNENEIYSVDGSLIFDETLKAEKITNEQAKEIALQKAKEEESAGVPLKIEKTERFILNLKILGLSDDETNYSTLAVTINSDTHPVFFSKQYFVDLATGNILYSEQLIKEVLNRTIYNCNNTTTCPPARIEGGTPVGNSDVDNAYTFLGDTYNYYKNNFNRDGYNNNGGPINTYVHIPTFNDFICPNAAWTGSDGDIIFCDGLVANDVLAHEYTHIVTGSTANLMYKTQSGALNESVSDIFGYALDPDDWTMGEDTTLGVIRRMDDPTQSKQPQPDRLFSSLYYCGSLDNGGVHKNNGVLIKAFYLMTAGGTFNGCTISGISKEKSHPIVYRALTTYLTQQSNFKAAYTALLQACSDLYQADSNECNQVKAALQATEMDQQPENSQVGAGCPGSGITRKTPECAASQVTPTITPTPGGSTSTPTPIPTGPTGTPTPSVTPGGTTPTTTPISPSYPITPTTIASPTPTSGVRLDLKLKFQGITNIPKNQLNKMVVKVIIRNEDFSVNQTSTGDFVTTDGITWHNGIIPFNVPLASDYSILIKGPKHIQKKICDQVPTETYPGSYHCGQGKITLTSGVNDLDFSGIYQLVGDLPEQDGIVNSYDVSLVRNSLNKGDTDSLRLADLNLDGVVNAQDYSLIIAALSIRTDEE